MNRSLKSALLAFPLLSVLPLSGCLGGSDDSGTLSATGPLDGTYQMSSLTCNGTPTSFLPTGATAAFLVFNGSTGSFITTGFASGCVATEGNVYTYPSSTTLTLQKVNRVCSGGSCSGSECTPTSSSDPVQTHSYLLGGTTLQLTRTSAGDDGCSNGQAAVATLIKQ
jgi:hypothetical protein